MAGREKPGTRYSPRGTPARLERFGIGQQGTATMSGTDKKHEQALDLTEQALEALDEGDERQADRLIDKAKKLDPSAPEEVVKDLGEG